ncbi:MAG: SOS response-associated peptidase [Opitutales bacterium]
MCGRYVITASGQVIADAFGLDTIPQLSPSYNIFPGQPIMAIRRSLSSQTNRLEANWFNWGLVPSWADSPKIAFKTINARSETARTLPTFREAYKYRRCIIPATGYYEWKHTGSGKPTPYFITRSDRGLILMAGLWEHWMSPDGSEIESATILTRDSKAHPEISAVHHRMPVMLTQEDFGIWYGVQKPDAASYQTLTQRALADSFDTWPVSDAVNKVGRDAPELLERVGILEQGELF